MEVGEEDLILTKKRIFGGQGLFDFYDEIGGEDGGVVGNHFGTGLLVLFVGITGAEAGIFFYEHLVTAPDELVGGGGKQGDAGFLGFDFSGNTDDHGKRINGFDWLASGENGGLAKNIRSD